MARKLDPDGLLQLVEEMIGVVDEKASSEAALLDELDAELFASVLACKEDHVELLTVIEDLQKQIADLEYKLQQASLKDHSSGSQEDLKKERDYLIHQERVLKEEERALQEKLEMLNNKQESWQTQKESLKKYAAEMQRNQMILSLCASTFHIIPSNDGDDRIAGNVVDSKGCVINTFGFDTKDMTTFDACEKMWSLCMSS